MGHAAAGRRQSHAGRGHPVSRRREIAPAQDQDRRNPRRPPGLRTADPDHLKRPPAPMFVDSHCHLTFPELASRLPEIRQAMDEARVDRALCICTTLEEFEAVHALALQYDNFWA